MQPLKTLIFIDGANFHNSLKAINLQEKDVDYKVFFDKLLQTERRLVRCYWYQPRELSFYDLDRWIPSSYAKKKEVKISEIDRNSAEYLQFAKDVKNFYHAERDSLDKRRQVYENICSNYPFVEFKYNGELQVDPVEQFRKGIKGDDVALAVDMITKAPHCDSIFLISGDYDYGPAVQIAKDLLKEVILVTFEKGTRPARPRFGRTHRRLRLMCDDVRVVYENEIPKHQPPSFNGF